MNKCPLVVKETVGVIGYNCDLFDAVCHVMLQPWGPMLVLNVKLRIAFKVITLFNGCLPSRLMYRTWNVVHTLGSVI